MKNLIIVNLKDINKDNIKEYISNKNICVSKDSLMNLKNSGVSKVYLQDNFIIAYAMKDNFVAIYPEMEEDLQKIKDYKTLKDRNINNTRIKSRIADGLICLNLCNFDKVSLSNEFTKLGFNSDIEHLFILKKSGVRKVYLDKENGGIVAYVSTKYNIFNFYDSFVKRLNNEDDILSDSFIFDMDSILDKISSRGMNSLTTEEKNYLKNFS